eukprot:TRINITY_DN288_c0_g2_i1.p1 TRINITY_DN288_c0_g2~~TRINITY_DN288_c0_g2_i1.p1  ORF type:complete len:133 (-),score=27.02 TRINITY_DN288_c0_g2_i1:52-393(-)
MKLLIASLIFLAFGLVTVLGQGSDCSGSNPCTTNQTCCKLSSGGSGCCPYPNACCCTDEQHCCPTGTQCDLTEGRCVQSGGSCESAASTASSVGKLFPDAPRKPLGRIRPVVA